MYGGKAALRIGGEDVDDLDAEKSARRLAPGWHQQMCRGRGVRAFYFMVMTRGRGQTASKGIAQCVRQRLKIERRVDVRSRKHTHFALRTGQAERVRLRAGFGAASLAASNSERSRWASARKARSALR